MDIGPGEGLALLTRLNTYRKDFSLTGLVDVAAVDLQVEYTFCVCVGTSAKWSILQGTGPPRASPGPGQIFFSGP